MSPETSYLTITVDKSHIITIGERLYEQSIELIRELVNNAYDADATRVDVNVTEKEIVVADNGEGMNMEGLIQYFNVGSGEKLVNPLSPRFGRNRIGQFGIGKFASLAAASRFEVTTQKGEVMDTKEQTRLRVQRYREKQKALHDGMIIPDDVTQPDVTLVTLEAEDVTQSLPPVTLDVTRDAINAVLERKGVPKVHKGVEPALPFSKTRQAGKARM